MAGYMRPTAPALADYPARLAADRRWALAEGSRHFEGSSAVFAALHAIARRLEELGIDYAVADGMALFQHGFRRFTEDIGVLVTPAGLARIHAELIGLGYLSTRPGGRNLRDTAHGVRIEFLLAGAFPGDGKPKEIAFPEPAGCSEAMDGVRFLDVRTLIELKLASGLTSPARLKDLADVLELIRVRRMPAAFAESLAPMVRAKFLELHAAAALAAED